MITDVGIDLDGVMYDFASVFHEYAQNRLNKELSIPTTWDFYHEWGLTDADFELMLQEGVQKLRLFDSAPPLNNTIAGWQLLKDNGISIHVLTHRGYIAYEQTAQWLIKYGLIPDSLHFVKNKTILNIIAKDECAAIDDYPLYYDQYEKAGILSFLRTQPWNGEKYARRVGDLMEFAENIIAINKHKKALIELPNNKSKQFLSDSQFQKQPITTNPHINTRIQYYKLYWDEK